MIFDKYKRQIMKKAQDKWGVDTQMMMAVEECSELIHAICKIRRGRHDVNIVEEIADVTIMVKQLAIFYGEPDVELAIIEKLNRLNDRLEY